MAVSASAPLPDDSSVRIASAADVERALSLVRDRAAGRTNTAAMQRAVGRAEQMEQLRPEPALPVPDQLREILPGGLGRGAVIAVTGSTMLLLALLGESSKAGHWLAIVGFPELGVAAADEAGIALDRLALVPEPGPRWPEVVATLLDGFAAVVVVPPDGTVTDAQARALAGRARQRGSVLLPFSPGWTFRPKPPLRWPGVDLAVEPESKRWQGLGRGHGRLKVMTTDIVTRGRGGAIRPRRCSITLPLGVQPPASAEPMGRGRHLRAVE